MAISPRGSDVSELRESIEQIGLQTPLVVAAGRGSKLRIVCGFRRVAAARLAGLSRVACRRADEADEADDGQLFRIQLWETLGSRRLSEVEQARVVDRLTKLCEMSDEEIVSRFLARLGGRAHHRQLRRYRQIQALPNPLKEAAETALSVDAALAIAEWPADERLHFIEIVRAARPGANRQRELIELVRDLKKRDRTDLTTLWSRIDGPSADQLAGQPSLLQTAIERLRRERYPRLSARQRRLRQTRARLGLPDNVRLELPPFFEGDRVTARIEAASAAELRSTARSLAEAGEPLDEMFEFL